MSNILGKIFGTGAKEVIGSVERLVDNLHTSKEEKEILKLDLQKEINRHFEALQSNATKELELELSDKANARNREIEVAKATGRLDYMNYLLAIVALGLLIYITVKLSSSEIPKGNEHILINLIGIVEGCVLGIYSYQFGSSIGSRIKDMIRK